MATRKSTRARAPARSHKAPADTSATANTLHQCVVDTASTAESGHGTTPPCSTIVPVPSAPRANRVSPRKREVPADAPAVEVSDRVSTPPISRRLSFGTAVSVDEDAPESEHDTGSVLVEDDTAAPLIAALQEALSRPTPKPKRKRVAQTPTPSPPVMVRSSSKGAKKPVIATPDPKAARQANPAKRLRPIARFDSPEEDEARVQHNLLRPTGTPAPRPSDSSYLADNEGEADSEIASTWSLSPSPHRPSSLPVPVSLSRRANDKQKASGAPPSTPSPIIARRSEPDVFGSQNVGRSGRSSNDPDLSDEQNEPEVDQLDGPKFPEIPPLLQQLADYLQTSSVRSRLRFGEIRPKFVGIDSEEPILPSVLTVLGSMSHNTETLALFDALLFRGMGVYVNPFFADLKSMRLEKSKVVFASGTNSTKPVVFVMPVVVETCHLLSPTPLIPGSHDDHLRLTGYVFDELFGLFSSVVCSIFGNDVVSAYMNQLCLQFSSRSSKLISGSLANSPQKVTRNCAAFQAAGSARIKPTTSRFGASLLSSGVNIRYPHSRGHLDTIPVYDGRHLEGDFRFSTYQWHNITQLPRFGVPPVDEGEIPDNKFAAELPELTSTSFSVALVAFTMGTFGTDPVPPVSFNLHFAILLGRYNHRRVPRMFTIDDMKDIRRASYNT